MAVKRVLISEISDSQGGEYEDGCCDTAQCSVQKLTGVLEVPAASIIRHTAVSVSILYGK
jgi:hypothetical protein